MQRWIPATSIGIIYSRSNGKVLRVFNPVYEQQLDQHHVAANEFMLRVPKDIHGITGEMTLDDLARLLERLS